MNRIDSFEFAASTEFFHGILADRTVPEQLLAPFQALLKSILESGEGKSLSIYLHSDDASIEIRSYFAHTLAKILMDHVPSVVLVDCDFLSPGLSGLVPQKDALGFLDYLLYGSSLGVVTQESTGGVRVIGAGSFPLTKKMPVSKESFEEASRRLGAQSRLAVFCGPSEDDRGNVHPVAELVDLPIYLSYTPKPVPGRKDPFEEKLAAQLGRRSICVRISGSEPVQVGAAPEPGAHLETTDRPHSDRPVEAPSRPIDDSSRPAGPYPKQTRGGSLFPKLFVYTIGGLLVVFIVWWLFITQRIGGPAREPIQAVRDSSSAVNRLAASDTSGQKPAGGETGELTATGTPGQQSATGAGTEGGQPSSVSTDQVQTAGGEANRTAVQPSTSNKPPVTPESGQPAGQAVSRQTPQSSQQTAGLPASQSARKDVRIVDDFNVFGGKYLIHISSFRTVDRAIEDAVYLKSKGFDACIVPVDLESKGHWYRVYVGPLETREMARELKIKLDELPRVTFTRITRAPGGPR